MTENMPDPIPPDEPMGGEDPLERPEPADVAKPPKIGQPPEGELSEDRVKEIKAEVNSGDEEEGGRTRMEPPATGGREDTEEVFPPEDLERMRAVSVIENPDPQTTASDIIDASDILNVPRDTVFEVLKEKGHRDELIDQVRARADELPPNLTPEEEAKAQDPDFDVNKMGKEFEEQIEKLREAEEHAREHPHDPHNEEEEGRIKRWYKHTFWDPQTGLFAEGNRWKTTLKFGTTSIFALVLTYMLLLNSMTKWAAKRVG